MLEFYQADYHRPSKIDVLGFCSQFDSREAYIEASSKITWLVVNEFRVPF